MPHRVAVFIMPSEIGLIRIGRHPFCTIVTRRHCHCSTDTCYGNVPIPRNPRTAANPPTPPSSSSSSSSSSPSRPL